MLYKSLSRGRFYTSIIVPKLLRAPAGASRTLRCPRVEVNPVGLVRPAQRSFFHSPDAPIGTHVGDDTIFALSTAEGKAGIAVVRISGPSCLDIYKALCPSKPVPKPRYASLRTLCNPIKQYEVLDSDALVLYFPSPNTVTGEDVLELHIHGGSATVKAVLSTIPKCPSTLKIRYAEPGEFTRRAFQNDRLDLSQVEALSNMLSAETEQQRRAAVRSNSSSLGRMYEEWRQQLLYARGELEALIDFSEDQHFDESPFELFANVTAQVVVMLHSISAHKEASRRGEFLRRGIRIALVGPPNAGKSSLLNQIVGREASIVTPHAGTTRDVVEVTLDIQGYLCTIADTAGLQTVDLNIPEAEEEGIKRAKATAAGADVVICLDFMSLDYHDGSTSVEWLEDARMLAANAPYSIIAVNKLDEGPEVNLNLDIEDYREATKIQDSIPIIPISCREAQLGVQWPSSPIPGDSGNIKLLVQNLVTIFKKMTDLPKNMEDLVGVTERQCQLLSSCSEHLSLFIDEAKPSTEGREVDIVLAAEHLRSAANCLSRITGRGEAGDVEEVLGVVFEKFCVGK